MSSRIAPTDSKPARRKRITRQTVMGYLTVGDSPRPDKVSHRFAVLSGRTVEGAHQFLLKLKRELALAARAYIECGAMDRWTKFRRPMDEVEDAAPVQKLNDAHLAEECADGAEDVAFARFQVEPTEANRRAYIRSLLHHETTLRAKARAVASEGGLQL